MRQKGLKSNKLLSEAGDRKKYELQSGSGGFRMCWN